MTVIEFSTYTFPSKKALTQAVRAEIDKYPFRWEFQSELVSDLIRARHPYCARHQLRPSHFIKAQAQWGRSGYHFHGLFDTLWHSVSWHKAITPPTFHDEARNYLRWNLIPFLHETQKLECEQCSSKQALEVHHASPSFEEIYSEAADLFTPDEIDVWQYYNWDSVPGFRLPPDHPVFTYFMACHENAELKTLCHKCHAAETKLQRRRI